MKQSRRKLLYRLKKLDDERQRLLSRLTQAYELAIGTVSVVRRKCGKPNCHCANGPGHPQTLFLFKDAQTGKRICKLVRRADEQKMLKAGERYREFRKDIQRLRAIDFEEKQILMAIAELRAVHYK